MGAITDRELEENKHKELVKLCMAITWSFLYSFLCQEHVASSYSCVLFQHQTPCLLSDSKRTPDTELKKHYQIIKLVRS